MCGDWRVQTLRQVHKACRIFYFAFNFTVGKALKWRAAHHNCEIPILLCTLFTYSSSSSSSFRFSTRLSQRFACSGRGTTYWKDRRSQSIILRCKKLFTQKFSRRQNAYECALLNIHFVGLIIRHAEDRPLLPSPSQESGPILCFLFFVPRLKMENRRRTLLRCDQFLASSFSMIDTNTHAHTHKWLQFCLVGQRKQ